MRDLSLFSSKMRQGVSPSTDIVQVLKNFPKGVSIDLLASVLARDKAELEADLKSLEVRKIVRREGDKVALVVLS